MSNSNNIESAKSQFAKTKDGWVVRILEDKENSFRVKYVDGPNIGKESSISKVELTHINGEGKDGYDIKAEDLYKHTMMRIDNIIGEGKNYKDLNKEEIEESEKN
jgi:CRISPR/Cas system CMR-associated protein Cmr3 (group 5 of RAMP superfamily)